MVVTTLQNGGNNMYSLRDYQRKALNNLYNSLKNNKKVLLSLPTGAGKTVMMAEWAHKMAQRGLRTAIIVDRLELIQQTYDKLNGGASVLYSGKKYQFDAKNLIHIVMLQTANRRMQTLLDVKFDFIFFDEIHQYCEGKMFTALCDCQSQAKMIGVSATPIDDKGYLLKGFDECINDVQTQQLINSGYLTRPIYYAPQSYNLDLNCIRMTGGDYDINQLDELMANVKCAKKIYQEWSAIAKNRKTIVFCSSIKQAEVLNMFFIEQNIHSRVVHSNMNYDERETYLYNFSIGLIQVVFNVGILVAGYDEPTVDCIVFANPTKILRRYLQQAGRGLRIADGKQDCLMLDCADIVREHGFCTDIRFFQPKQKEMEVCTIKQCPECGAIVSKNCSVCLYCGYDFSAIEEKTQDVRKKDVEKLEKAFNMQQELKSQIGQLVDERGYKHGYKWFLFIDCLKTKHPTESSIQFFKRKLNKIKKIKKHNWKLASLKYN